jgi:hypothetical protein
MGFKKVIVSFLSKQFSETLNNNISTSKEKVSAIRNSKTRRIAIKVKDYNIPSILLPKK